MHTITYPIIKSFPWVKSLFVFDLMKKNSDFICVQLVSVALSVFRKTWMNKTLCITSTRCTKVVWYIWHQRLVLFSSHVVSMPLIEIIWYIWHQRLALFRSHVSMPLIEKGFNGLGCELDAVLKNEVISLMSVICTIVFLGSQVL